eukprot:gene2798-3590_t
MAPWIVLLLCEGQDRSPPFRPSAGPSACLQTRAPRKNGEADVQKSDASHCLVERRHSCSAQLLARFKKFLPSSTGSIVSSSTSLSSAAASRKGITEVRAWNSDSVEGLLRAGCVTKVFGSVTKVFGSVTKASLWRLALAGCGFSNLTGEEEEEEEDEDEEEAVVDVDEATARGNAPVTPLAACVSLTDLDLSENEFTSIRALLPLTQLRVLDLQGNEDLPFYKNKVVKFLPKLAKIDGDGTGMGTGEKYRGVMCYEGSGTGTVFGSNVDRSSCSCVEGNPCAFPDSCEDWKNRCGKIKDMIRAYVECITICSYS